MTAVSQSYPNYLGGLNEQPDELKKPGQLVEALNVIPDPVIGLTRRPGFELVGSIQGAEPGGTWFEMELSNQVNEDYIYFGCVNTDGTVSIINQDGVAQIVRYTDISVTPHQKYSYSNNTLKVVNDNDVETDIEVGAVDSSSYLRHQSNNPIKYCVSKNHIILTNPDQVPTLDGRVDPTTEDQSRYYSFINLKLLDTSNYNYKFKRFFEGTSTYRYIKEIDLESVDDILADYDKDLTLPLQTEGPFRFNLEGPGITEEAVVEVTFVGQIVQLESNDGDGFRNEARYSWSTKIITQGKGYEKGQIYRERIGGINGNPPLDLTFRIGDVTTVTGTTNVEILPTDITNKDADELLVELAQQFKDVGGLDTAIVVGSGLYLEHSAPFSISTAEIAVADVLNSQKLEDDVVPIVRINSVAELPVECYAGFIVEVVNSFNNENNYYLQYNAESETDDIDITKADGYWEEIRKPFELYNPESSTLPHMITVARVTDQTEFAFIVSPIDYKKRTAGTAKDNPSMFKDASPITAVNYYKNRLFFFTKVGTVISSRAGEIDNLFLNTAINTSLIDPIDIIANSNQRVPIHAAAVVNNAMVLFGDSEQYSMTTETDILTSETANVTKVSNYTFDPLSEPIYLGTNIAFISGSFSRFYEMTNVYDRGPIDINERSQQIQSQFGQGFNMPVSSREQSMAIVYKKFTDTGSRNMYLYRFRQESSQEITQSAWVKWQVNRPVTYVSLPQDKMFIILDDGSLYRMDSNVLENLPASVEIPIPRFTDGYTDTEDGAPFETRIKFPTIYAQGKKGSNITANTTIHRVKLSTAAVGAYDLKIERKGYDTYNILVEQTPSDEYRSEFPPLYGEKVETVPVYTRNTNLTLTMSTSYDAPLTLQSMTWEGDWNPPYYKSV